MDYEDLITGCFANPDQKGGEFKVCKSYWCLCRGVLCFCLAPTGVVLAESGKSAYKLRLAKDFEFKILQVQERRKSK